MEQAVERAFAPVSEAVAQGRIPGAALGCVRADGRRAVAFAGLAQKEPDTVPMTRETVFDLASLTKVMATMPAVLDLHEDGRFDLDQPLGELIPDLRQYDRSAPERALTVRQCLSHRTFLPAVEPLYTLGQDASTLKAYILQRAWPRGPAVYSDINFMLLGLLVERMTGRPMAGQRLSPGLTFRPDAAMCAATELCRWRGRILRGEVHDENAFALGGDAGHAGLFGAVDAVLDFAAAVLAGSVFRGASTRLVRTRQSPHYSLGFEIARPCWQGGEAASDDAVGHTGFTGTGLWIDARRGLAWTLLTNRVHPTRHFDSGIFELRPLVGTILLREMT